MQNETTQDNTQSDALPAVGDTRRGRDVLGLPVYSIDAGKRVGEITGLLVRRESFSLPVVRIQLLASKKSVYLAFNALRTVGIDIALVESEAVLENEIPESERGGLEMDLPGRPVLTRSGANTGHVVGFGMDTGSGCIASLRIEANTGFLGRLAALGRDKTVEVPIEQVISIGPDAVIVQDEVAELVNPSA